MSAHDDTAHDDTAHDAHVEQWRRDGWTLFEGLIPEREVDAAVSESWTMFAPPEVFHAAGEDPRARAFRERIDPDLVFGDARRQVRPSGANNSLAFASFRSPAHG